MYTVLLNLRNNPTEGSDSSYCPQFIDEKTDTKVEGCVPTIQLTVTVTDPMHFQVHVVTNAPVRMGDFLATFPPFPTHASLYHVSEAPLGLLLNIAF